MRQHLKFLLRSKHLNYILFLVQTPKVIFPLLVIFQKGLMFADTVSPPGSSSLVKGGCRFVMTGIRTRAADEPLTWLPCNVASACASPLLVDKSLYLCRLHSYDHVKDLLSCRLVVIRYIVHLLPLHESVLGQHEECRVEEASGGHCLGARLGEALDRPAVVQSRRVGVANSLRKTWKLHHLLNLELGGYPKKALACMTCGNLPVVPELQNIMAISFFTSAAL